MLDFIINPIAGGKDGKRNRKTVRTIETILKKKGIDYTFHFSSKRGDAKLLTERIIGQGATDVIVVGGDGTLHEVINGFSNFDGVTLGIIPCGTGNDFASALNLPFNVEKALDVILNGNARYVDYMQMPTVRGLNIIGTGIDVDVLKRYESLKRKNKFGYTRCLVKTLFDFSYSEFTADLDGQTSEHHSFIAGIANGHRYGGGIPICPVADPFDGKLDFIAVKEMPKLKIIGAFVKLKSGKVLRLKETVHRQAEKIKIDIQKPYTVNVDGELYDDIPFEVEIVSNTLKVYN